MLFLRPSQEYLTYTTVASVMVKGNWTGHGVNPRPSAGCWNLYGMILTWTHNGRICERHLGHYSAQVRTDRATEDTANKRCIKLLTLSQILAATFQQVKLSSWWFRQIYWYNLSNEWIYPAKVYLHIKPLSLFQPGFGHITKTLKIAHAAASLVADHLQVRIRKQNRLPCVRIM